MSYTISGVTFYSFKELTPFEQKHFCNKQLSGVQYSPEIIEEVLNEINISLIKTGVCEACGENTFTIERSEVCYFFDYLDRFHHLKD